MQTKICTRCRKMKKLDEFYLTYDFKPSVRC